MFRRFSTDSFDLRRYVEIWIVTSLCTAAIVSVLLFEVPKCAFLTWAHPTTPGVVTNVDRAHHGDTTVRFDVKGTTYTSSFLPAGLGFGAAVLVRYCPSHSSIAILEDPRQALTDGLTHSAFGGCMFGTFLTLVFACQRFKAGKFLRRAGNHSAF